jgi:formamidopyrimidine-DNA glycosylase
MPELPETETIARDLDQRIRGAIVADVAVTHPDVLRGITAPEFRRALTGARVIRVWRRAKLVVLDIAAPRPDNPIVPDVGPQPPDAGGVVLSASSQQPTAALVVQPRFTGALLIDDGSLAADVLAYSTLALRFADGRSLHYRDIRRLGTVALLSADAFAAYVARLGPEPLDAAFTVDNFRAILRRSRQAVKKVLMNQQLLAGVGNIYATEALWRAGVDPSRASDRVTRGEAANLYRSLVDVLHAAIAARGTSFRDYRDASGARGAFVEQLEAYGRAGQPCRRCGARLIGTHAVDGRMSVFCARCQR